MKQLDNHIDDNLGAKNKAGVSKWLIEALKGYDGMMSTNPDKEHKWQAKRELERQIEDFYRNKIPQKWELYGEPKSLSYHEALGYNQAISDITAQFNKGDSDETSG